MISSSTSSTAISGSAAGKSSIAFWRFGLPLALFSVLWLDLIRLLSNTWETREQYSYGWLVPFFAAALLWHRWMDRPAPHSLPLPLSSLLPAPRLFSAFCFLFSALAALSLLPLRVIFEINADWPLICWVYSIIVVGLTLYAFHLAGGWPWVKHFSMPVALILVAIAWPYRIEKGLTQDLMQVVARLTVELLCWMDIPAMQQGNLISLSTGTVGIDEACSGIRSFQSSLMAGILMGELYRLKPWTRLWLVGYGIGLAFCFNVVRTLLLTWQADKNGLSAIDKWHDPAGFSITVACSLGLWAIAALIKYRQDRRTAGGMQKTEDTSPSLPLTPVSTDLSSDSSNSSSQLSAFSFSACPGRYLLVLGCWAVICIGATEAWYRSHAIKDQGVFHWSVAMPESKPSFQKVTMAPRTVKLISADLAATGKWQESDGTDWTAYFFRWQPKSIQSVIMSRVHRPDVCLPASGLRQVGDSKPVVFDAAGLRLPFRAYTYEAEGRTLHVFFCRWEDGADQQSGMEGSGQEDRLQSVITGRRKLGQQTLEFIITGHQSLDEATQALGKQLPALIRIEQKPAGI